jgi:hypothetical protein
LAAGPRWVPDTETGRLTVGRIITLILAFVSAMFKLLIALSSWILILL